MSNLPQQIKDAIAKEANDYHLLKGDLVAGADWQLGATTWAERGQKLADALRKIEKIYPGDTTEQTLSNILLAKTYATNALSEWNQSINKEESVKHPPAKNMGTCQRCDINPATTTYSDLKVCDHCDKMLNDEFDREYQ